MLPSTMTARSMATSASSADPALHAAVADLIKRLVARFPSLSSADLGFMVSEWASELADMQPHEIQRGLDSLRRLKFAPSLGEFCLLCRPALDPEWAWQEAQEGFRERAGGWVGVWSHPAVFRAAAQLAWEIPRSQYKDHRAKWDRVLHEEFKKGWGDPVPPPPVKISHQPSPTRIPPEVRQRLHNLRHFLNSE